MILDPGNPLPQLTA